MIGAPSLRFEQAHRTHPGTVRAVNEDATVARLQAGLWAVADGMGGHADGAWASGVIADALEGVALPDRIDQAAGIVATSLAGANTEIWQQAQKNGTPIGSTVAALLVRDDRFVVLWAGDSRVYRQRGNGLDQLTTDHSQVESLAASGLIDRSEIAHHPMRNILARSVGTAPTLALDRVEGTVASGDTFLLCSDGLTGTLAERELGGILRSASPDRAAQLMLDRALEHGARDNVTIAIVGCEQATQLGEKTRPF